MMKKRVFWLGFSLSCAILCLCHLVIPTEVIPTFITKANAAPRGVSHKFSSTAVLLERGEVYAAQPTVDKPYMSQGTIVSKPMVMPAAVRSYSGGVGVNRGGDMSTIATPTPSATMPAMTFVPQVSPRTISMNQNVYHRSPMRASQGVKRNAAMQLNRATTAAPDLSLGYASAAQYMAPAVYRAPGSGLDNALNNWLINGSGSGALVSGDATTGYYYDMALLQDLFNQMQANGDMPGMTWEQFMEWFTNGSQNRHFMPVGDAWWLLALLALGYGVFVYRKHKHQTMITAYDL